MDNENNEKDVTSPGTLPKIGKENMLGARRKRRSGDAIVPYPPLSREDSTIISTTKLTSDFSFNIENQHN